MESSGGTGPAFGGKPRAGRAIPGRKPRAFRKRGRRIGNPFPTIGRHLRGGKEKKGDSGKESSESPRKRKFPVGVLKWRKDEETDEVKKENSTGKGKVFRLPDFGKDEEEPGEEPSSAQRRLRKVVKVLWIPTLLFGSLRHRLMIGYAGLGGQSPLEVFAPRSVETYLSDGVRMRRTRHAGRAAERGLSRFLMFPFGI